jgi:ankyrin repeat protein
LLLFSQRTPLHYSAWQGNRQHEICKQLLRLKADVDATSNEYFILPLSLRSLLLEAYLRFHLLHLSLIYAFLFASDSTPLHYSAWQGNLEVCRLLLQRNANVQARNCRYIVPPFLSLLLLLF